MRIDKVLTLMLVVVFTWMSITMVNKDVLEHFVKMDEITMEEENKVDDPIIVIDEQELLSNNKTENKQTNTSGKINGNKETTVKPESKKEVNVGYYVGKDINEVKELLEGKLTLDIRYIENCDVRENAVYYQSLCNETVKQDSSIILHVSSGGYSEWIPEEEMSPAVLENDELYIEKQIEYSYRTIEYTSSSNPSLSGWIQYNEENTTTNGSWSMWQTTPIEQTNDIEVETRSVKVKDEQKTYTYSAYFSNNSSKNPAWSHFCSTHASSSYGGDWDLYKTSQSNRASISSCGQQCPCKGFITNQYRCNDGKLYYFEEVSITPAVYQKEYRSRTLQRENTYYYYRYSDWTSFSTKKQELLSNMEEKQRVMYRYKRIV